MAGCPRLCRCFLQLFGISQAANGNVHLELEYGPDSFWNNGWTVPLPKFVFMSIPKEDLIALYRKVKEGSPDIPVELIEDAGLTEFHGVPAHLSGHRSLLGRPD